MSTSLAHGLGTTQAHDWLTRVAALLRAGQVAPYLGPTTSGESASPRSYRQLADLFATRVALPKRARGNPWASAQYVESQKHRSVLGRLMREAFAQPAEPSPLQRALARLPLPLIVDSWYDDALHRAIAGRADWAEVHGISRAALGESRWVRARAADGQELTLDALASARTLLYKPHGTPGSAESFLLSDADYVEVLTEIDIQSPIPEAVRARRESLGFVFLGCRFDDQMLRTYARQITKRSAGPRFVLLDPASPPTRSELRFVRELDAELLLLPEDEAFATLASLCE